MVQQEEEEERRGSEEEVADDASEAIAEMSDDRRRLEINSEDEAWDLLDKILKNEIDADDIVIDLTTAKWAEFRIIYKGEIFKQSVSTSTMQGIVDFQFALYRSIALALRDGRKVSNLTDDERKAFELVFKVTEGSSDLAANAKDILAELSKAFAKMSGKQISVCAIVIACLYFGNSGLETYLTHVGDDKKIELEKKKVELEAENAKGLRDIISDLAADKKGRDRERILEEARKQSDKVVAIDDEASKGYDSIIRHSSKVDEVIIQGRNVGRRAIEDITAIKRRKSKQEIIRDTYTISGVDTTDPRGFIVKLQSVDSEQIITATLFDMVGREKFGGVIQRAEWGKTKIVVQLAAKTIGDDVVEARILKAHTARIRKAP